jgi:hypothetical protein
MRVKQFSATVEKINLAGCKNYRLGCQVPPLPNVIPFGRFYEQMMYFLL